ncbi:MAG: DUF1080 domain-containing protein [Candidatus Hydrogenedentes bacterium]|nr:DUF1080 domain-containing protein [Candidatus Hydrogenedentota bacterium]
MLLRPLIIAVSCLALGCATAGQPKAASTLEPKPDVPDAGPRKLEPKAKVPGFGMTLNVKKDGSPNGENFASSEDWRVAEYIGSGGVWVQDGACYLGEGNDMTGIAWGGPLPSMNYEVTLEAQRVAGGDFFCGLTFPYGKDPCSLIVGGWGGRLVGISSLDWLDASENGTATWRDFENGKWYPIRLRITPEKIEAWVDGEQLVDVETQGRGIGIRFEVDPCRPFGIATWRTTGAVQDIRIRAFGPGKP